MPNLQLPVTSVSYASMKAMMKSRWMTSANRIASFRLARRGWSGWYCGACLVTSDFEEMRSGFPARGKDLLISCSFTIFSEKFYIGLCAFTTTNGQNLNMKLLVPPSCTVRQNFNHWWLLEITWRFCWLLSFLPGALPLWGQILSPSFLDKLPVSRLMWHWCHFQYHHKFGSICLKLLWSDPAALLDGTHSAILEPNYAIMAKVLIINESYTFWNLIQYSVRAKKMLSDNISTHIWVPYPPALCYWSQSNWNQETCHTNPSTVTCQKTLVF